MSYPLYRTADDLPYALKNASLDQLKGRSNGISAFFKTHGASIQKMTKQEMMAFADVYHQVAPIIDPEFFTQYMASVITLEPNAQNLFNLAIVSELAPTAYQRTFLNNMLTNKLHSCKSYCP